MQIEGKQFAVTGGGSGLGRAVAETLVARGARVAILERDEARGNETAAALGEAAVCYPTDVTDPEAVATAVDRTAADGLHGLINCAGIGAAMKVVSRGAPHDLDVFKMVIEVNLIGSFNCLRLAAAAMAENAPDDNGERGVIINTASIAAYEGQKGQVAYAASKGGVVGLTLPAARDLARHGIRVVTLAPGLFDTPLLAGLPEEARQALADTIPFPSRLGLPEEYALLAEQVLRNPMLNGETIRLDGALRMV